MNELNLAFYIDGSAETVTLEAYAQLPVAEKERFRVDTQNIALSLKQNGQEKLATLVSWGNLKTVSAQLGHVIDRINNGKDALLRSGVSDVADGHYLLLETGEHDTVSVSLLFISGSPLSHQFPTDENSPDLYAYVRRHVQALKKAAAEREYPVNVPFDTSYITDTLEKNRNCSLPYLTR